MTIISRLSVHLHSQADEQWLDYVYADMQARLSKTAAVYQWLCQIWTSNTINIARVVSSEISGNLFQSFRKFPEIY